MKQQAVNLLRAGKQPARAGKPDFLAVRLNSGIKKRSVLPLSLQKTGLVTVAKLSPPQPVIVAASSFSTTFAPSWRTASRVARMSSEYSIWVMRLVPAASAAQSTARCAMLLLGGTVAVPPSLLTRSVTCKGVPTFRINFGSMRKRNRRQ